MTWNLWWRFGPWQQRQSPILAELRAVNPDVAFLQEVWADTPQGRNNADADAAAECRGDQAQNLADGLGMSMLRTVDDAGQPQGFGNAILSRWPLELVEQVALPDEDGNPSRRTALLARISAPTCSLLVAVTHLSWEYYHGPLRQEQLRLIVERLDAHYRRPEPQSGSASTEPPSQPELVVVAGDLNAPPNSDEVRRLTGLSTPYVPKLVFTDAWAAVTDEPGHTWDRHNPHRTDSQWPRRRLDYLMVGWPRPKPLGNPRSAVLAGKQAHDGVVPSDHYGVVAEIDRRVSIESPASAPGAGVQGNAGKVS